MELFTSDPHIDDDGIVMICGRPYKNAYEMRKDYIDKINSKAGKGDKLFFLGDLMMYKNVGLLYDFIRAIDCRNKVAILGNHDELPWYRYIECGFWEVHSYLNLNISLGKWENVHLVHDPSAACVDRKGLWISGHLHSGKNFRLAENHFDCGVDGNNGFPYTLTEIAEVVK